MKKLSFLALVATALSLPLTGCNSNNSATDMSSNPATNTPATNAPEAVAPTVTNATVDTSAPSSTPAPTGVSTGAPLPGISSKNDTNTSPDSTTMTSPASENARADTNAAPAPGGAQPAPSQNSK